MFSQYRTSVLMGLALFLLTGESIAQSINFFPPLDIEARREDRTQVVGKIGTHFYVYHNGAGAVPQILILNDSGRMTHSVPLDFIQSGVASSINILLHESSMNFIIQELKGAKHYVKTVTMNENGERIGDPQYIDSSDYEQYGSYAYYRIVSSPNKKHYLLYRIAYGFSSIQILFNGIVLDEQGVKTGTSFFYLPFNSQMETVGNIFVTDEGKMILPVHDKFDNFKLGTTLKIYYSTLKNQPPVLMDFYFKENKPAELLLDWDNSRNRLALGGLYYNFYSKNIEGAMVAFINPDKKTLDTVLYMSMDKSFKKQLKHKVYNIPSKEVINSLRVRYFDVNDKGEVKLLTDLFTNASLYGKMAVSLPPDPDLPSSNRQSYFRPVPNGTGNTMQERDISNYFNTTSSGAAAPGSQRIFNADRNNSSTNTNPITTSSRNSGAAVSNGRPILDRNFSRNQTSILNNTNSTNKTPSLFDAGNLAASNKTLNYKSVLFRVDSLSSTPTKSWIQNFFVPGTEFSNIIILPGTENLGIVSYELTPKNNPILTQQRFQKDGSVNQSTIGNITDPMIFYKKNSVLLGNDKILTLYVDPTTNKLGLALIK